MGSFGITELLIILAIVVLLFGTKHLKSLGSDLGSAIKGFRSAIDKPEDEELDPKQQKHKPETNEKMP